MNKMNAWMEDKLVPVAVKVSSVHWLTALKDSMIAMMPFLIIGSLFLLVAYLPIPNWSNIIGSFAGTGWESNITIVKDATFGVMAFMVLIGMTNKYAKLKEMDDLIPVYMSLAAFFILTPAVEGTITLRWFGSEGLFVAIIISVLSVNLFGVLKNMNVAPKMPEGVPPGVVKSFDALFPVLVMCTMFLVVRLGLSSITQYESVHDMIFQILQTPLMRLGGSLPAIMFAEGLGQLLWFFGLHGNAIVSGIMSPIWLSLSAENLALFSKGLEPVNIVTGQFKEMFLQIGGSGSTLSLVILMMLSKRKDMKTLGFLALPSSLFNINEPVIFGLPIVLNPIMFIPWMLNTAVFSVITYTTMSIGLVQKTTGVQIPWTTPPIINGFLVSGISGAILQVVLIFIGIAIYMPFLRVHEKALAKEEAQA